MKKCFFLMVSLLLCLSMWAQEKPAWVTQRPVNELSYSGIGVARKTEKDYAQAAKQRALSELASEIKVEVSVNSLLNTIDDNDQIRQVFAESIQTKSQAELERYRLIGTWQDDQEYWVYYELNRSDYEEYMEARRQKAIQTGFDFWYKGQVALQSGELMTAIELFSKGLEAIEPAIHLELNCMYENQTINLATELYASLAGVFNGVAVIVNPSTVEGTAFKGVVDPIAVGVYRNDVPLKNIRLTATFLSGSGDLSSLAPTDDTGVAALSIRNITSKQAQQEIRVSIVTELFKKDGSKLNAALLKKIVSMLPEASLTITLAPEQMTAYLKAGRNDLKSLELSVKGILTTNFFDVASSPEGADLTAQLETTYRTGGKVPGELYNFVESFGVLTLKLVNNRTGNVVMFYSTNDVRVLVPENKSGEQAKSMVARELMKKVQRELGRELKKITVDRSGELPAVSNEPKPSPVVTPSPVVVVPVVRPTPKPAAEPVVKPKAIGEELDEGIFIEFAEIVNVGDKSRICFKIINETGNDFAMCLYKNDLLIVNEKGEEQEALNIKIGSKAHTWTVTSVIVPNLPTEMVIEVNKLASVALFGLKDCKNRNLKLRNLK